MRSIAIALSVIVLGACLDTVAPNEEINPEMLAVEWENLANISLNYGTYVSACSNPTAAGVAATAWGKWEQCVKEGEWSSGELDRRMREAYEYRKDQQDKEP